MLLFLNLLKQLIQKYKNRRKVNYRPNSTFWLVFDSLNLGVVECHPKLCESHTKKVGFHTKRVGCHPKF
jgi:hypothetical protein